MDSLDNISNRQINRVGFGLRFSAFFIDSSLLVLIIFGLCYLAISAGFGDFFFNKSIGLLKLDEEVYEEMEKSLGPFFKTYLIMIALSNSTGLLYSLIEAMFGASPGKMLLGLKIAFEDGSEGDMYLFMKRWILKNLGNIIGLLYITLGISVLSTTGSFFSFLFLMGCFFMLNDKKQGLHDILCKSAIFKKEDLNKSKL